MQINLILSGASGKMGQEIFVIAKNSTLINKIIPISRKAKINYQNLKSDLFPHENNIIIDFSNFTVAEKITQLAYDLGSPLMIGTTALGNRALEKLHIASHKIPILQCANSSMGINILVMIIKNLPSILKNWDKIIIDTHHKNKIDSPSGTSLLLEGELEKSNLLKKSDFENLHSAIRFADIIGKHEIIFSHAGEEIKISHECKDRKIFALNAFNMALWLATQKKGLYTASDYLSSNLS